MGEPVTLAEQAAAVLRQSSWWGRHRILGFCLLPPLVLSVMVGVALSLDFMFGRLYFPPAIFSVLADQPPDLKFLDLRSLGDRRWQRCHKAVWLLWRTTAPWRPAMPPASTAVMPAQPTLIRR